MRLALGRVRDEVLLSTGNKQEPFVYGSLGGAEIALVAAAKAAALPVVPGVSPNEAAEAWDRIKNTSSVTTLEAYIRRFADTFYGDLARARLVDMKQADATKQAIEDARAKATKSQPITASPPVTTSSSSEPAGRPSNSPGPRLWEHNGSVLELVADGAQRTFQYQQPKPLLRSTGVKPGTVLFRGRREGARYIGTAYFFPKACGGRGQPYEVSGDIASDEKTVTLRGRPSIVNSNCETTGRRDAHDLIFTYLGGNQ